LLRSLVLTGQIASQDIGLQRIGQRVRKGQGKRQLLEEIVGSQHDRALSLDVAFEELTRCSLLNCVAQPQKLIYSLICLHIMFAFKMVHRGGADRAPHRLALIEHREINDHSIEVVAHYFTSLQRHWKSSVEPHVPSPIASECTARPSIIPCPNAVELSNNIIQKGLAFGRDWSGTVVNPERWRAPRSCPAGSMAEVGLWWCGATPPSNETEDLDVKVCEEAAGRSVLPPEDPPCRLPNSSARSHPRPQLDLARQQNIPMLMRRDRVVVASAVSGPERD
jgi:hypothetical protein